MTTVGYGDISASTAAEKVYSIVSMLVGGFMFGMIVGSLTNIIGTSNPLEATKKQRLDEIAGWLQLRNVPSHLRTDIYEFYRTMYNKGAETGIDERVILQQIPHTMAEPLKEVLFSHIMKMQCWTQLHLHTLPYWSQIEVCMHLRPVEIAAHHSYGTSKIKSGCMYCCKKTLIQPDIQEPRLRDDGMIFEEGVDDDRSIYLIREGIVDIKQKGRKEHLRLVEGDCFGQSCLIYIDDDASYTRNFTAHAATDCLLYMLNRSAIHKLAESVPAALEHLKPEALRRQERVHTKALRTLREQGVSLGDGHGSSGRASITAAGDDAALINGVVNKVVARLGSKLMASLKEDLDVDRKEVEALSLVEARLDRLESSISKLADKLG